MNTDVISEKAIEETADDLQRINKEQLLAGYDKKGELIGSKKPYQNPDYAFYKANKNPLPGLGNPDLFDTGAFYEGFETIVQGDSIIQDSTDEKAPELEAKYGEDIFGLGGKFKEEYLDESLRTAFKRAIESATGLKFE